MAHGGAVILAGVLGGLAGGLGAEMVRTLRQDPVETIERAEARSGSARPRTLERAEAPAPAPPPLISAPASATAPAAAPFDQEAFWRRLEERVGAVVEKRVEASMAAHAPDGAGGQRPRPMRRAVPLAEAAREIGLSPAEEDAIRRIHDDLKERAIAIVAGPDGDVEQVRRDYERRDDPMVVGKYMPRVIENLPKFMELESERRTRTREAIGDEKSQRLSQYRLTDIGLMPQGMVVSTSMGMERGGDGTDAR